MNDAIRLQESK